MEKKGYLEAHDMDTTFNMLRANDLIWSFVVNNYLLGKEPFPFDLLYWNADSTRMPAAMHSFYLRKMYQENLLVEAGRHHAGRRADRSAQDQDAAPSSCRPARTISRRGARPTRRRRFTLARSSSCCPPRAISPAWSTRRAANTGIGRTTRTRRSPDDWLAGATHYDGSWWPVWENWIAHYAGGEVPARQPGDGKLKPIEDAPGSYVKVRAED